jgi:hypothetical protein
MSKLLFENFAVYTLLIFGREINFLVKVEDIDDFMSEARNMIYKNMEFFSSYKPNTTYKPTNDKAKEFVEKLYEIGVRHEHDSPDRMPYGYFRVSSGKFKSGEYFTVDGFYSMFNMNSTTVISSHGDCMICIDDLEQEAIRKYLVLLEGKICFESHFFFNAEKEFYEKIVIDGKTFVSENESKQMIQNLRIIQFIPIVFKSANQSVADRGILIRYEDGTFNQLMSELGIS